MFCDCDDIIMETDSSNDDSTENVKDDIYEQSSGSADEYSSTEASSDDEDCEIKPKRKREADEADCNEYFYLKHSSQCGPKHEIEHVTEPLDIFSLLITDAMINNIVVCTNQKIGVKKARYKKENSVHETNPKEIKALIGLLILSALTSNNRLPINFIFNTKYSGSIFKATMTCERCRYLLSCLKFKNLKKQSIFEDKFTPIKDMWNSFTSNCKKLYNPGDFVTVGEHMISFRGRCPFKTYSPDHKCRYGIKMVMLADTCSKYIVNALPLLDTDKGNKKSVNLSLVRKLTEHLNGSNRNVTIANNFASVPLATLFLQDPYKLTIVGALKSKICNKITESKEQNLKSEISMFGYNENMKLLSYKPKQNKRQFIISTIHNQPAGAEDFSNIDLLQFYNKTKNTIDDFRKTNSSYTVNRRTDSWETCIFYFMLDIALMNLFIIYTANMNRKSMKSLSRRELLTMLGEQLTKPWLEYRFTILHLPKDTKKLIGDVLGKDLSIVPSTPSSDSTESPRTTRKKCAFCHWKIHRMTRYFCKGCKKPICGEHNVPVCHVCAEVI